MRWWLVMMMICNNAIAWMIGDWWWWFSMMIGQACLAKRRQTPLKRTMGVALLDRMMPALHKHNEVIMSIIIIRQVPAASGLVKLTTSSSPPHPETHNRIIIISIEIHPPPSSSYSFQSSSTSLLAILPSPSSHQQNIITLFIFPILLMWSLAASTSSSLIYLDLGRQLGEEGGPH